MGKHKFIKLVIDGKTLFVFAESEITKSIRLLDKLKGIKLLPSTRKERRKYLVINK